MRLSSSPTLCANGDVEIVQIACKPETETPRNNALLRSLPLHRLRPEELCYASRLTLDVSCQAYDTRACQIKKAATNSRSLGWRPK